MYILVKGLQKISEIKEVEKNLPFQLGASVLVLILTESAIFFLTSKIDL